MSEPRPRPESERSASEPPASAREAELVEFVRSIDVRAPDSLHRHVEALVADASRRRERTARYRRPLGPGRFAFAGALAAVVVAIAIAIGLSGGGSRPFVRQASVITLGRATTAAPRENPRDSTHLAAAVDGVAFPYWEERFGWRSTGARTDRLNGRTITTVFYADRGGRQIGYAIVAGAPAPRQDRGTVAWRNGTPYHLLELHGANVVIWLRDGRLCVVAGRGVSSATLLALASWGDRGSRVT